MVLTQAQRRMELNPFRPVARHSDRRRTTLFACGLMLEVRDLSWVSRSVEQAQAR